MSSIDADEETGMRNTSSNWTRACHRNGVRAAAGWFSWAAVGGVLPSTQILPVEQEQFFFLGHNFCWYDDGWQGPGWYWCNSPGTPGTAGVAAMAGTAGTEAHIADRGACRSRHGVRAPVVMRHCCAPASNRRIRPRVWRFTPPTKSSARPNQRRRFHRRRCLPWRYAHMARVRSWRRGQDLSARRQMLNRGLVIST